MSRLADRLISRLAPKANAQAGCSYYRYCRNGVKYVRICCLDQGCQTVREGSC
ncbi:hypothetical protein [Actinomadura rudentiformis]|uniref:hypothetical protein n=1 Tax=Actinomadura rudentiformis TaxID=359158 RepID=UPI00178C41DE|nr:hypothetical protein [Actinomadura rudentiformis]